MITAHTAVERARALRPRLLERAAHCEEIRRCPDETIADLFETELMQLMQPARFGGSELGLDVAVDVSFELASACPSTAWVWLNLATHSWNIAQFDAQTQEDVWGADPRAVAATGTAFPCGQAKAVDGGYRVSGRWPFASGVDSASWMLIGAMVARGDGPREPRLMLVPHPHFRSLGNWGAYGLTGTGSHDVVVEDVFVPEHRTVSPNQLASGIHSPGAMVSNSPVYRLPMFAGFGFALASVPLGATLAAVSEFTETLRKRVGTYGAARLAEMAPVQMRVAEVSACIDFALNTYRADLAELVRLTEAGDLIDDGRKLRWKRNQAFAMTLCKRATESVMAASGAGGLSTGQNFQRFFRDTNAAAAHIGLTWDVQAPTYGRHALGMPLDPGIFV
jgi:alkylation response protein AidB-like acyl-CoA dehydrogenase